MSHRIKFCHIEKVRIYRFHDIILHFFLQKNPETIEYETNAILINFVLMRSDLNLYFTRSGRNSSTNDTGSKIATPETSSGSQWQIWEFWHENLKTNKLKTKDSRGFTLIEILIAITISAFLMTGVLVFVTNSIERGFSNKKMVESQGDMMNFNAHLSDVLGTVASSGLLATVGTVGNNYGSGMFLKMDHGSDAIAFIGLKTATGYCDALSSTTDDPGIVQKLAIRTFSTQKLQNVPPYTINLPENAIYSGSVRIIGTGYPGNTLSTPLTSELSSPSALALLWSSLYIADTGNDRILRYDTVANTLVPFLDRSFGINKPTSLAFSGNTLLIADAGNGTIHAYKDGGTTDGTIFSTTFSVPKNITIDSLRFNITGANMGSISTGSIAFSNLNKSAGDNWTNAGGSGVYTFSLPQPLTTGSSYMVTINNLTPLASTGTTAATIDFLSGGSVLWSDSFRYFTRWDGDLNTPIGNTFSTIANNLLYPNTITGPNTWSGTIDWLHIFDDPTVGQEILSPLPVSNLQLSQNGNILTLQYEQYDNYDCAKEKHKIHLEMAKVLLH